MQTTRLSRPEFEDNSTKTEESKESRKWFEIQPEGQRSQGSLGSDEDKEEPCSREDARSEVVEGSPLDRKPSLLYDPEPSPFLPCNPPSRPLLTPHPSNPISTPTTNSIPTDFSSASPHSPSPHSTSPLSPSPHSTSPLSPSPLSSSPCRPPPLPSYSQSPLISYNPSSPASSLSLESDTFSRSTHTNSVLPMPQISEECECDSEESILSKWERPPPLPIVTSLKYSSFDSNNPVLPPTSLSSLSSLSVNIDLKSEGSSRSSVRTESKSDKDKEEETQINARVFKRGGKGLKEFQPVINFTGGKVMLIVLNATETKELRNDGRGNMLLYVVRAGKEGVKTTIHSNKQCLLCGEYGVVWPQNQFKLKNKSERQSAVVQLSFSF